MGTKQTHASDEQLQTNILFDRSGIVIETDKKEMVCYFSYKPSTALPKLTSPVVKASLKKAGVTFGFIDEEISSLNGIEEDVKNRVVARGRKAIMESDTSLKYRFNTDPYKAFQKAGKGEQIDYRERGSIPWVKAGTILAEIVSEEDPKPGMSVTGKEVEAEFGEKAEYEPGKNVSIRGNNFVANIDGAPRLDAKGKVEVSTQWVIDGDVEIKTGNVRFPGKVIVKGIVQPGFEVYCKSLQVQGVENKCKIEVEENLIVDGGIQGGTIVAGGRIESRFINNAHVSAGRDIDVRLSIINSDVRSSGGLSAQTIFGGVVAAKTGVSCVNLSSEANRSTVIFGVDPIKQKDISDIIREKIELEEHLNQIKEKVGEALEIYEKYHKQKEEIKNYVVERDALVMRRKTIDPDDEASLEFFDLRLEELGTQIDPIEKEIKEAEPTVKKVSSDYMNEIMEVKKLSKRLAELEESQKAYEGEEETQVIFPKVVIKGKALSGTRISSSVARALLKKDYQRVVFVQRKYSPSDKKRRGGSEFYMSIERL